MNAGTMYAATASKYADGMLQEMDKNMYGKRFSRLLSNSEPGCVIDVGCGSGDCLALMQKMARGGKLRFVGVDPCAEMLAIAKKRAPEARLILQGAEEMLPPEEDVHAILCYFVIHHVSEAMLAAILAQWHQILAPGGRILIGYWHGEQGAKMEYPGQWASLVAQYYAHDEVERLCREAGFSVDYSEQEEDKEMGMVMGFVQASK